MPSPDQPTSPVPPGIQHVFVLMLENRSFDHMLGFSGIVGTDAVTGERRPIDGPTGPDLSNAVGNDIYPVNTGAARRMAHDPGHEFVNTLAQLCGPGATYVSGSPYPPISNSGFAADYATVSGVTDPGEVMKCYGPNDVPALTALASEFAVCDRWFASMPGPTWPNRFFAHAASSGHLDLSPTSTQIAEWTATPNGGFAFEHRTLFAKPDLDWRIYVHDSLMNNTGALADIRRRDRRFVTDIKRFYADLRRGDAAQYTFIEPSYGDLILGTYKGGNSQHPVDDVLAGDRLIADVYNAIRNSAVWPNSLLIVTWDEHGGFYDHVAPPAAVSPGDRQIMQDVNGSNFAFDQYGVRVPAVVVSPLIPKNIVDGRIYDHASIPATVEALFGLTPMTERDKQANHVLPLATLTTPRDDCPTMIQSARPAAMAAVDAAPEAAPSAEEVAAIDAETVEQGNLPGFIGSAMRLHLELAPEDQRDAIIARVAALQTVGDAAAYMDEVRALNANSDP